jgi:hypothetical protein
MRLGWASIADQTVLFSINKTAFIFQHGKASLACWYCTRAMTMGYLKGLTLFMFHGAES